MPAFGVAVGVAAAGLATGLLVAAGLQYAGPKGAVAPALALLCIVLLRFPGFTFGLLVVVAVMAEAEATGIIPSGAQYYNKAASSLTPPDILLLIGLGGVLLRFVTDDERPLLPDPLTLPLILMALALAAGAVTALGANAGVSQGDLFHRGMHIAYIFLVPLLAVNVIRDTRSLKLFAVIVAALGAIKGIAGLYVAFGGVGNTVEEETISFLNPVPNLLMLILVLGVVAALIRKVKIPLWMMAAAPISLLSLVLSFRRSFWIAAAFTLIVVIIIASRRRGRAVLAIGAITLALAVGAAVTIGSSDDPSASPLAERAQTLSPSSIGSNRGDRYRVDERQNVIENIEAQPLTGIGLGVNWKVHQPLAEAHDRRYAHVATLWYWLALGPLGLIAYVAIFASGLWTAVRIWRRHPDEIIQVCAIAAFGAILGLGVVELTATFTGIEPRVSLILGAALGWLAAAWRDLPPPKDRAPSAPS
ncbi:MAG TPA: O-antigen ligase family protein [Solirubrobacterales bacterium]|nr:O-antigen ligase family protein [Solirubrobacterales bacterium]